MHLPASPASHRRELGHRERARLEQLDQKLDLALAMVRMEAGSNAKGAQPQPSTLDADVEEVGRALVTGHLRLPRYATYTVTTSVEERKDPIFGTSTILHHTADQFCVHALQPMSIQAAIERKLLTKVGGHWLFRADVYRQMVPPDPRLLP
jgi:hypothetical protein